MRTTRRNHSKGRDRRRRRRAQNLVTSTYRSPVWEGLLRLRLPPIKNDAIFKVPLDYTYGSWLRG